MLEEQYRFLRQCGGFPLRNMLADLKKTVFSKDWRTKSQIWSKLNYYFVSFYLLLFLAVIMFEVVKFFLSGSNGRFSATITYLAFFASAQGGGLKVCCIVLLWFSLSYLARNALIVLLFSSHWSAKFIEYSIRLMGSLPTIILGNAILLFFNTIGFYPTSSWGIAILVWLTLILVGLPTVLQIGQSILNDYDKKQLLQARSLGINKIFLGKKIVYKSLRRSFNAAVLFAVSRILIEGYIVLDKLVANKPSQSIVISNINDFSDVFYKVYASMTIQQNIYLILVLFIIAIAVNIWSYGVIPFQKVQV